MSKRAKVLPRSLHKFRHARGALVWDARRRRVGGMRIFECVCAFMNFRQGPLSAGLWESAYSTERLLDCQCDRQWLYVAQVGWSD